jgi:hypothetical protein
MAAMNHWCTTSCLKPKKLAKRCATPHHCEQHYWKEGKGHDMNCVIETGFLQKRSTLTRETHQKFLNETLGSAIRCPRASACIMIMSPVIWQLQIELPTEVLAKWLPHHAWKAELSGSTFSVLIAWLATMASLEDIQWEVLHRQKQLFWVVHSCDTLYTHCLSELWCCCPHSHASCNIKQKCNKTKTASESKEATVKEKPLDGCIFPKQEEPAVSKRTLQLIQCH